MRITKRNNNNPLPRATSYTIRVNSEDIGTIQQLSDGKWFWYKSHYNSLTNPEEKDKKIFDTAAEALLDFKRVYLASHVG